MATKKASKRGARKGASKAPAPASDAPTTVRTRSAISTERKYAFALLTIIKAYDLLSPAQRSSITPLAPPIEAAREATKDFEANSLKPIDDKIAAVRDKLKALDASTASYEQLAELGKELKRLEGQRKRLVGATTPAPAST